MKATVVTAPAVEPVTLADLKLFLRLESGDITDDCTVTESLKPDNHPVTASYGLQGAGVDVLGKKAVVYLEAGTCGASGTVDLRIEESDDDATYAAWPASSFAQVTEANDEQVYSQEYTGDKQYIRAAATVGTAACDFAAAVYTWDPTPAEDDVLSEILKAARERVEHILRRKLITQTWDFFLDGWPPGGHITMPWPSLQSVTTIKYKDEGGTEATWAASSYIVDADSIPGRVVLASSESWPGTSLYPSNPITVRAVVGYGAAATNVPSSILLAIKILAAWWYGQREPVAGGGLAELPMHVRSLLADERNVRW